MAESVIKSINTENKVGNRVDLSSYATPNVYVCPSDGFIVLFNNSQSNTGYVAIGISGFASMGGEFGTVLLFCPKGY